MSQNKTRTGTFVEHLNGYKYFLPNDLPPDPPIDRDDEVDQLLSMADRALGRLDSSLEILPNPHLFVSMYSKKEAVLSSQIEGTQASLIDVLKFEVNSSTSEKINDAKEVVNYIKALNYGIKRLKKLPICLRLIREIHKTLMEGVRGGEKRPGAFRESQNYIANSKVPIQQATFIPPDPKHLNSLLKNLEEFINDDQPMSYLLKIGLIHAQFETIHPFLDGNGRTGRLLITFLLYKKGILQQPLLYLSHYFKQNQSEYYSLLRNISTKGEWEPWLKFFLKGIYEVSQEATKTARKIMQLREFHRNKIQSTFRSTGKALEVLDKLYWFPCVNVKNVKKVAEISYANANSLVKKLEEEKILKEVTGKQRNRIFIYSDYLNLFN